MSFPYRRFIEENFLIISKPPEEKAVPFIFNRVQRKYYSVLRKEYSKMDGLREIILKARQTGFSSLILALFTVDFIVYPNSTSVCISHKTDATEKLFKRVRFYIKSYCEKNSLDIKEYLKTDNKAELENKTNGAYFYLATAGAKVGGRGQTVRNLHLSEAAYYQSTGKFQAKEIIEGSAQQVPQNHGMIFIESTGKNYGDYFQKEYARGEKGLGVYKARFFGWQEFYTDEWIEQKKKEFQDEKDWKKEYPSSPDEAFLHSGEGFFSAEALLYVKQQVESARVIKQGRLAMDGNWI